MVDLPRWEVIAGSAVLHSDDTPIPVLAPGSDKTLTGRLRTCVRDKRPDDSTRPSAAVFFATPDRRGERYLAHIAGFSGVLVADGFNGFDEEGRPGGDLTETGCWAQDRPSIKSMLRYIMAPYSEELEPPGNPVLITPYFSLEGFIRQRHKQAFINLLVFFEIKSKL